MGRSVAGSSGFFDELKRRHVWRVAVAYAVVSWMLVQLASVVFPAFGTPDWVLKTVIVLLSIGFPSVVLLAWAFEITPDGIRRTLPPQASMARTARDTRRVGRWLDVIIIAVLVLAVALLGWRLLLYRETASPAAAVRAITPKSIAVLPFQNLSADQANAFFADGIQDEILTGLARIGDLKVISRTSTTNYASHPGNLRKIAAELGVATILEGSVQKVGDQVLINVQLIDARTDSHVWAQSYQRKLDDIFGVEGEVATRIAVSLHAVITHDEHDALAAKPTDNPQAYTAYLKGRALLIHSTFDQLLVARRVAAFQEAVTLDPRFTLAWAELVRAEVWMYWEGFDPTPARLAAAKAALDRAMALAPAAPQVALAHAWYLYYGARDFQAALVAFRSAQAGLPNDEGAWVGAAAVERRLGQFMAAAADFRHALTLSPNNSTIPVNLAQTLLGQRRFAQAHAAIDHGLALNPDSPRLLDLQWYLSWATGANSNAQQLKLTQAGRSEAIEAILAAQALYRHDYASAAARYQRAVASNSNFMTPSIFGGYIPAAVGWRLQWALCEDRRNRHDQARLLYDQVKAQMQAALVKKPGNIHVEVALRMALGEALAGLGEPTAAVSEGRQATAALPETKDAWEGGRWLQYLARIYAMNGDSRDAVPLLDHLLGVPGARPLTTLVLRADPIWDPIRHDRGFQTLLQRHDYQEPGR